MRVRVCVCVRVCVSVLVCRCVCVRGGGSPARCLLSLQHPLPARPAHDTGPAAGHCPAPRGHPAKPGNSGVPLGFGLGMAHAVYERARAPAFFP